MKLSQRAERLAPSATLAMAAKANKMRKDGIDVISFATGEPDFDTPENIRNTGMQAIDEGFTRYTPSAGIPELRNSIARKLKKDNDLSYNNDEIVVTCGAKQAIYNALQVLVDAGDEVLIPAPYWVSYPEQVKLADGTPVIIPTDVNSSFKINPEIVEKHLTKNTKVIILNSPSNPTGSAYTPDELASLGEFLVKHKITIISDEIYEKLVYGDFFQKSIATACPGARDSTIVINGVSKAYAMTGWRMGYAAGPRNVISKMASLVGQQNSGIPAFVQLACIEALEGPQVEIERMKAEFKSRRDFMLESLLRIPGIVCPVPSGTFYLFPDVSSYFNESKGVADSTALAEYLLTEAHIATVSGDAFGSPGNIRFSYANSMNNIKTGMERLSTALKQLK
ncbi:MAG: pyridoxal phosphate-dependent aminotransferase [Deltaproteobacteria bacterium]|nr:pyridoxal phosphate-dependent aminotransferase [Deltaproteobacteria bacterium]